MVFEHMREGQGTQELDERLTVLEEDHRSILNGLIGLNEETKRMKELHRATLDLLEDVKVERIRYHETLRALLNILEDVEEERLKVERTKARLEVSNDELEAFSYSISHDLRAPLRAISGLSRAVLEDLSPRLNEGGRRYLALINENAVKMSDLIDNLLEFSRLGSEPLDVSEVDLGTLALHAFEELRTSESEREVSFIINPVPRVRGDLAMLRQAMVNLVSNAIKYTRQKERAIIEFGHYSQQHMDVFYIKDNGVGFDMQYVEKMFNVFSRLHPTSEFEGTGVGLALVRRIIERHGGRIWAEGLVDEGATFRFTLPRQGMA